MKPLFRLKPNKRAFIIKNLVLFFLSSLIGIAVLGILFYFFLGRNIDVGVSFIVLWALALFVLVNIISFINVFVRYRKEEYVLLNNKIILKKGTIFSDHETELVIKNITQVWLNLPFIERKLFGTGNLMVRAAGSGETEIFMSALDNPSDVYRKVSRVMEDNGFVLSKKKLVQKEKPSSLAVFFEVFKDFFSVAAGLFVLIAVFLAPVLTDNPGYIAIVVVLVGLFLLSAIARFSFKFMDLKRRVYYLYEDVIDYEDGFFTENYSFIPIENLSDSEITQTFVDKVFDLYDVVISSQGSKNNIVFSNMRNGKMFKKNLDDLIRKTPSLLVRDAPAKKDVKASKAKKQVSKKHLFSLKMDMKRTILPVVFLIALGTVLFTILFLAIGIFAGAAFFAIPFVFIGAIIIFLLAAIPLFIQVTFTKYRVNQSSVEEDFSFLTAKNKEFTNEKVTAVTVKESFIDRFFGTVSFEFNSIGSSTSIKFSNVIKKKGLVENILGNLGVDKEKVLAEHRSGFSFVEMLKANFFLSVLSLFLVLASVVAGLFFPVLFFLPLLVVFVYIGVFIQRFLFYRTVKLRFFENYVFYTRGILFTRSTYSLYQNVKDLVSVRYPFSRFGSANFNVAGEIVVQDQQGRQSTSSVGFTVNYLESVDRIHEFTDGLLLSHPLLGLKEDLSGVKNPFSDTLRLSRPSKKNYVFPVVLVSVVFFPLLLVLPFTLAATIIVVNRISYHVKPARVERLSGVFFRKKLTVLYNRFDHISSSRGLLNKMFGNGNVIVYTAGSSLPELSIRSIPDWKDFYKAMEENY